MGDVIEMEPLPDTQQVKRRGRPKKSSDDMAKERESDVQRSKIFSATYVRTN